MLHCWAVAAYYSSANSLQLQAAQQRALRRVERAPVPAHQLRQLLQGVLQLPAPRRMGDTLDTIPSQPSPQLFRFHAMSCKTLLQPELHAPIQVCMSVQ